MYKTISSKDTVYMLCANEERARAAAAMDYEVGQHSSDV